MTVEDRIEHTENDAQINNSGETKFVSEVCFRCPILFGFVDAVE
jgi:hypothetical protein